MSVDKKEYNGAKKKIDMEIIDMLKSKDREFIFYVNILQNSDIILTEDIPTTGLADIVKTLTITFLFNPIFVNSLKKEELQAVFIHELKHLIHAHCQRIESRDHICWNIACDMAINPFIENLPSGALSTPKKFIGKSSEYIYENLDKNNPKMPKYGTFNKNTVDNEVYKGIVGKVIGDAMKKCGVKNIKDVLKDKDKDEDKDNENDLWGSETSDLMRSPFVQIKAVPNLPELLRDFCTKTEEYRRTLKRPDRRNVSIYGKLKEHLPSLTVIVDCSGSISNELLNTFTNQVKQLEQAFNKINVVFCDCEVKGDFSLDSIPKQIPGGGGTSFDPALSYINNKYSDTDLVVYFTDGEATKSTINVHPPIVWVIWGNYRSLEQPQLRF